MLNIRNFGWRTAFWICLAVLISESIIVTYFMIDQGVSLAYQKEGYSDTESDLDQLIELINKTDLTKSKIQSRLKGHKLYQFIDLESDTIELNRILMIFKNNRLIKLETQW